MIEDALKQPPEPSHPSLTKPYFHEYQSLKENNSVRNFELNFSYLQRLSPEFDSRCQSYIDTLTKEAESRNKTPFLQFNRSFLCMDYFDNFHNDALNAYFYRNPRSQFTSYKNSGRAYYIGLSYLQFAAESRRNNNAALRFVNVPFYYSMDSIQNTLAFYNAFSGLSTATSYYIFFCLWCIGLINAIRLGFPCISVDTARSKQNLQNGVIDFFEKEFPHLNLQDYSPKSHIASEETSETCLAVEKLVISHLIESDYQPHMEAVQTRLSSLLNGRTMSKNPQNSLLRHIADELRFTTDANFAAVGNGLNLDTSTLKSGK